MRTTTHSYGPFDISSALPVAGGMLIATAAAFILRFSYLWAALVTVGLLVMVVSFTVSSFRAYWLAIFAVALPLEIKKLFGSSEYVTELVRLNNIPVGELPAPVLYLADLPFLVLMAYWLFEIATKKEKVFFPKSNWLALGFVAWAGLSIVKAPLFSYAFFDFVRLVKFYLIYLYIANNIRTRTELKTLITFLLAGVAFQGLICLYQYVSQDVGYIFGDLFGTQQLYSEEGLKRLGGLFSAYESGPTLKRSSGTVGPINSEALYFEYLLPIALIFGLAAKRFWGRSFNLAILALGVAGLLVTFSRGGLLGLLAGVLAVLFLARSHRFISTRTFALFLVSGLLAITVALPMLYGYLMSRPEAATARIHLLKVGLDMIRTHPILGVGLNNHLVVSPQFDPDSYLLAMPTHNHYLLVASEIGIPGLLLFLGLLLVTFSILVRSARSDDRHVAALSIGIFGAYVAVSVHVLVDWLATNTNLTLFWLYAGLAPALGRFGGNRADEAPGRHESPSKRRYSGNNVPVIRWKH
jgi:O-antigen ligase